MKYVHTPASPLTSDQLRRMIDSAQATSADAEADASHDSATDRVPWTSAWSTRLATLDLDKILSTVGAALDEHHALDPKVSPSKLSNWQEIEIPDYAPLMRGEVDHNGKMKIDTDIPVAETTSNDLHEATPATKHTSSVTLQPPKPEVVVEGQGIEEL